MNALRALMSATEADPADAQAVLPAWRQVLEKCALFLLRGIGPGYYLQARWWRADIPFSDKWDHPNRREYNAFIDRVNAPRYQKISQHKLSEKAVLCLLGLPTAPFVGYVHATRGRDRLGHPLRCAADLENTLGRHVGQRICFKRVEGFGGFGFVAYDIGQDAGRITLTQPVSGERLSVPAWWAANANDPEGFVLEEYLRQHAEMAALNRTSVNTIRIWVYEKNGEYVVPGAYLRVGRSGSQVDNNSSGGLCCPVDVERGTTRGAMDVKKDCAPCHHHPDTGAALAGFRIPHWNECVVMAGMALSAFPHMRVAGLDMAVTPEGPCLIELNVRPDYIGCAWMDLPLRRIARAM